MKTNKRSSTMVYLVHVDVKANIGISVTANSFEEAIECARKKMNGRIWAQGIEYNDGNMRVSGVFEQNDFDTHFDD